MIGFDIRWRGKRIGNEKEEWLIGSLYDDGGELYILPPYPGSALDYEDCQINPNTLGIWIGRNDKYGFPIYTGDLLQDEKGKVWRVWMKKYLLQVIIEDDDGREMNPIMFPFKDCIVQGSIFD